PIVNEIHELVMGGNLNLTNCPHLKKLIVPDNPYLNKLIGLNLATNTNTLVNLAADLEAFRRDNLRKDL
ncbi:17655_t:CDS:1, partial [Gigaspora margarita]